jgi:hypothetical protein
MKIMNKKTATSIILVAAMTVAFAAINGCKESEYVAGKGGAQLWAENCQRCHNTPDPITFTPEQWQTVGLHMQTRALLTNNERDKIVGFLQTVSKNNR